MFFIAARSAKGDKFSKIWYQDENENEHSNFYSDKKDEKVQSRKKRIYILGPSMIKNLKDWEMSKKLKNTNVYLRHFVGAKVRCMKNHTKT